ncbi:MAG: cardiolipin synthase [Chloroflexi bacterium]|nr:MAG: cardiolipin synthase [Chloroflexota bacterium]
MELIELAGRLVPPLTSILLWVALFYAIGAAIFLLLDNRSPQSTFAWLLWFYVLPIGGVLIYIFFGRNWRAFSHERRLMRLELGAPLLARLRAVIVSQRDAIEEVRQQTDPTYHRLLNLVRHSSLSALTLRNDVELLQNASAKYPRLLEDIRQARHSIHMQYFIWQTDAFTRELKDLLIAKAREGVVVRILYDALGCFGTLRRWYMRELQAAGVDLQAYSPVWHFHTIGYRNHRKIVVIDGRIGYTGGLNIGQEHLENGWRDTHLRIVGEGTRILQAMFIVDWYNATGTALDDPDYFPEVDETDAYSPLQIVASGPDSQWAAIRQLYFFMIMSAQREVYLQSPFFILDESVAEALKAAALAGVKVHVMIAANNFPNSFADWAANTYAHELGKAGVHIHLYHDGYLHAKTVSIDGEICSVGSANMDIRSFNINYELNALCYERRIAQQLEADFQRDLAHCTEFSWRDYEKRHPLVRLRDSLARLLSPLQ